MIRWGYLAPRAAIVGTIVVAIWILTPIVVHWSVIRLGRVSFGNRFDVQSVEADLFRGNIKLQSIRLPRADKEDRDLLQASEARLEVATGPLVRGRYVVNEIRLEGVQFDGLGQQPSDEHRSPQIGVSDETERRVAELLSWLGEVSLENAERVFRSNSRSLTEVERLSRDWPQRYDDTRERIMGLIQDVRGIRQALENVSKQPDPLKEAVKLTQQMLAAKQEYESIVRDFRSFEQQIVDDKSRIEVAIQADQEKLEKLFVQREFAAEAWTQLLLGDTVAAYLKRSEGWISWGSRLLAARQTASQPIRKRGTDYQFQRERPPWLIRNVLISGTGTRNQGPFAYVAQLANIAPGQQTQPVEWKLKVDGSLQLHARGSWMDTRHQVAEFWSDDLELQSADLGRVQLAAKRVGFHAKVTVDSERTVTRLKLTPQDVQFQLGQIDRNDLLAELLHTLSDSSPDLELVVQVEVRKEGGSEWQLESNAESQLVQPLKLALRRIIQRKLETQRNNFERKVAQELKLVRTLEFEQQQRMADLFQRALQEVRSTTQLAEQKVNLPRGLTKGAVEALNGLLKR